VNIQLRPYVVEKSGKRKSFSELCIVELKIRMGSIEFMYSPCLYSLGRFRSGRNLCYANASLQCLFSWRPFVDIVANVDASSPLSAMDSSGVMVPVRNKIYWFRAVE